jgi:hypothetical protein
MAFSMISCLRTGAQEISVVKMIRIIKENHFIKTF